MDIKDIAGSDIKQLLEYIEEQSSKDNADLYRYEFTHIVVTAANHPSLSVEEYKKLLATSSGSGRRWTYRRISFVDKIYDYVSMGILPMVQHKRKDLPPEYTSFISMLRERLARTDLSSRTIENYVDAVWSFCAYMAAQNVLSFKNITEQLVVAYFNGADGKARGCTISRRIRNAIRKCLDLWENGIGDRVIAMLPDYPSGITIYPGLSKEESAAVEKVLICDGNSVSYRSKAICSLAFYAGLRESDISGLTCDNVNFKKKVIHVKQQKTGMEVIIPLDVICSNLIVKYVRLERPPSQSPCIFISKKARDRLSRQDMYEASLDVLSAAGVHANKGERKGLHLFRHHMATSLIETGANPAVVSAMLGHRDPSSALRYLNSDLELLKRCSLSISEFA